MIRPAAFCPNEETAADNTYQVDAPMGAANRGKVANAAILEVENVATVLKGMGVDVILLDDLPGISPPDSVFPNNWISTHYDSCAGANSGSGTIVIYPMAVPSRRRERRQDITDMLLERFNVSTPLFDLTALEDEGVFLEGTGALVLDHINRIAYMAKSGRGSEAALLTWCEKMGYTPEAFNTCDPISGKPIYHTNVMLSVATEFAVVCLECIPNPAEALRIRQRLTETGHKLIILSNAQVAEFAGNGLELTRSLVEGGGNRIFAMSTRAAAALTAEQVRTIERFARIVSIPVPTIELAGGSVRCMLAGLHFPQQAKLAAAV